MQTQNSAASVATKIDSQSAAHTKLQRDALIDALDSVSQGLVICDADGVIITESTSVRDWLELGDGSNLGLQALNEVLSLSRAGRRNTRSIELLGPPPRALVISGFPIVSEDLVCTGAVAVIEDSTYGRHEDALIRDFIANISHELKTPVGALGLLAEALLMENEPAVKARLLERIQVEADRVNQVIDDLLNLSSVETPLHIGERLTVRSLVGQALARISYVAEHRNISVDIDIVGNPTVYGAPRNLVSAFHHLLENAVKYSPDNSTVSFRARSEGEWAEIVIEDSGIGIPPEYLERIFERFFRVDDARKRSTGGTGLGLAIVRQVVQRHGGEVRAQSSGEGTKFFVRLPSVSAVARKQHVIEGGQDG